MKRRVRGPAAPLTVRPANRAVPPASVVAAGAPPPLMVSVPPPAPRAADTTTPAWRMGTPALSTSCTTGWVPITCDGCAPDGWVVTASRLGAVLPTVMGADTTPDSPAAVNCSVRSPSLPESVSVEKVATPALSVVAVSPPDSAPPPLASAADTATPATATAFPDGSTTCTAGCSKSTTPLCASDEGCRASPSADAPAAPRRMAFEVTAVRSGEENCRRCVPAVPVSTSVLNAATPAASVVTVTVPPSVPPPSATAAVTGTPAQRAGAPRLSCSCTSG